MSQSNIQQVFSTVSTQLIGKDHEALLFKEDGHLEVENWARNFTDNPALDHLRLERRQALELSNFLNKPEVRNILEQ